MASKSYAHVDKGRCVSCGACVKECPKGAVEIIRGCFARVDEDRCVGCGKCCKTCPAEAISLRERGEQA